jgi:hypothetical protein
MSDGGDDTTAAADPAETAPDDTGEPSDDESFLGALSLIGLISFCCIGIGAATGTAALAGGAVGTTVAIGGASTRGTLITALVTALTVVSVALVVRWRRG